MRGRHEAGGVFRGLGSVAGRDGVGGGHRGEGVTVMDMRAYARLVDEVVELTRESRRLAPLEWMAADNDRGIRVLVGER